jgi:adenine-specific DNA methylase
MSESNNSISTTDEFIMSKIYFVRGKKVMLDKDLAELYGVENKQLKRTVRRNVKRFPEDFMFELSDIELNNMRKANKKNRITKIAFG